MRPLGMLYEDNEELDNAPIAIAAYLEPLKAGEQVLIPGPHTVHPKLKEDGKQISEPAQEKAGTEAPSQERDGLEEQLSALPATQLLEQHQNRDPNQEEVDEILRFDQQYRSYDHLRPSTFRNGNLKKRSAEPKRLPAHRVMEKHFKLAETSPELFGIEDLDELRGIWESNLPYPMDGSPATPGGPIIINRRAAEKDSRIIEQRQKENEIRQTYGKPTKIAPIEKAHGEKDYDLKEVKKDKDYLSTLASLGYKLDYGKTDVLIITEQEQVLQEQEEEAVKTQSCSPCQGNIEKNRDKEAMRRGDGGIVQALFYPPRQD